ncbi:hypothetical protein CUZ56_01767 [Saezia sanguinis]|uniref:Uncharacterized protein n=1 Tax=Saezia sanguinis TaxID=1965230 RepID=A0A433SCK8_9BURK|nr:hypothetical protein [Saezia sanguinis]RUS66487.1 hypothetical protein CUZ56_01767 [Saezia sanguinis]
MTNSVEQTHEALRQQQNGNPLVTDENVFSVMEDAMDGECPRDAHGCKACERRGLAMLLWQRERTKQEKQMQTGLIRKVPQMVISTLLGLLLGVAAYADTATAVAEPVTTQSATASAPAHAVTLYGLTLGEVVPQLPECHPDVAFGRIGDDICITYAEGFYSAVDPHLKYGTADEVVIWFPDAMQINGYPQDVVVGTDENDRMVYFKFDAYGQRHELSDEFYPPVTPEDQQRYMTMFKAQLGEPDIYGIRVRVKEDDEEDSLLEFPPGNIPRTMWQLSAYGSVLAVWNTDDVWAKYIGEYYSQDKRGFFEVGLRSMFTDGQVPDK